MLSSNLKSTHTEFGEKYLFGRKFGVKTHPSPWTSYDERPKLIGN